MKIALVTPKMASGERGGAENLYDGLLKALNEAGHDATQVNILVDETTFEGILEAYCKCFYLDLNEYDLVISTKAPTYMVRHRNHISYLLHTIRVFYDMYDRELFCKDAKNQRKLIHKFDRYGLDPSRIKAHFVNGSAVYKRMIAVDDFWKGVDFKVLHHPPNNYAWKEPECGKFIFFPGRLHRWKRPELIIQAMNYVKHDVELLISGQGEDESYYRQLAKDNTRIKFLGWISDDAMTDLYAKAIVVPFVPMDEDYGLITIEAFKSKKPVITCTDSGEPAHIVKDKVSGFIVDPDPKKIAEKIDYLIENPRIAQAMGLEGFNSIQDITWGGIIKKLLGAVTISAAGRILVTDNQVLDPPIGGGRVRIYELYKNFDPLISKITYLGTFDWLGNSEREQKLADHFNEILIPMTVIQISIDRVLSRFCRNMATLDVTTSFLMKFTPKYQRKLHKLIKDKDTVIVTHPWVYPYIKKEIECLKKRPKLIYDSHNVEYKIKKSLLNGTIVGRFLAREVRGVEGKLVKDCDLIFACSEDDRKSFSNIYGAKEEKILLIPNGAAVGDIPFPGNEEKNAMRTRFGFGSRMVAIFLASGGYKPNDMAAEYICHDLAPLLSEIDFILVGSVCETILNKYKNNMPKNIQLMGVVNKDDKIGLLYASDLAINPVTVGSGTNIKIFDYLAAGLPIVTTPVGARGIDFKNHEDAIIANLNEFPNAIKMIIGDKDLSTKISFNARALAERYDWRNIAKIAEEGILGLNGG